MSEIKNEETAASLVKQDRFLTTLISGEEESRLLEIIKTLSNAKNLKIENHADALALCIKAKELDLPMSTALDHCFIVNGKVGIDVHIAKAKLLSSNIISWEKTESYKPLKNYTDGRVIYDEDDLPENFIIVSKIKDNEQVIKEHIANNKYPVAVLIKDGKPVITDYRTTYRFVRIRKMIDGSFSKLIETSSFSVQDAISAGLISDGTSASSPWIKYRKAMLDHRAFMNGARAIADDLLLGIYSVAELLDSEGKSNYRMNEDGTVIVYED